MLTKATGYSERLLRRYGRALPATRTSSPRSLSGPVTTASPSARTSTTPVWTCWSRCWCTTLRVASRPSSHATTLGSRTTLLLAPATTERAATVLLSTEHTDETWQADHSVKTCEFPFVQDTLMSDEKAQFHGPEEALGMPLPGSSLPLGRSREGRHRETKRAGRIAFEDRKGNKDDRVRLRMHLPLDRGSCFDAEPSPTLYFLCSELVSLGVLDDP